MNMRKVHIRGQGALGVTLPIGQCRNMGIEPGTYVNAECIDGRIVLTPVSMTRQDHQETGAEHTAMEGCGNV